MTTAPIVYFGAREIETVLSLVMKLDPAKYTHDEVKAVIYKCKALPTHCVIRVVE